MKIICPQPDTGVSPLPFYNKTDNAILQNRKPFFLPQLDDDFVAYLGVAIKIKKIGKCIEQRFAHRYYDAAAVALDIIAPTVLGRALQANLPTGAALNFDGALHLGDFLPKENFWGHNNQVALSIDNDIASSFANSELSLTPEEAISQLSEYQTLKIGDIIVIRGKTPAIAIRQNMQLALSLNGEVVFECNVK